MQTPAFRVKRYAHPKYNFVVRAKLGGKWKRRYFRNEREALAFARKQNAISGQEQPEPTAAARNQSPATPKIVRPGETAVRHLRRSTKPATISRKALVILGMHRSGTSALGGALNILGVDFGKRLAPAGKDNEKGYWEHPEIVTLHDELLRLLNSKWDADTPLPANWAASSVAAEIQSLLLGVVERDFSDLSLFGLKDPRMCRLMPLWFPIFEKLRIEPHFLLTVRHPWEVVQSLLKRDNFDPAKSYLLWLDHTFQAEASTRGYRRSFVSYETLLEDDAATLTRLKEELGVPLSVGSRTVDALSKFLRPALRHHRLSMKDYVAESVPSLAREIYAAMSANSSASEISEKMLDLSEEFARGSALFFPRIDAIEARIASLDQQVAGEGIVPGSDNLARLQVFHPLVAGYLEPHSETRYFVGRTWKLLSIDLPAAAESSDRPLRIDPATYPAVIDIAEIALKRAATGEVLWSATSESEFADFEVGGTAGRLFHERYLRILSFGSDPQFLLPAATIPLLKIPARLELLILVDNRLEAIRTSVTAMRKQAEWKARAAAGPFLTVYVDPGDGFNEEHSLRAPLELGTMQTIRFDDFDSLCESDPVRLRIHPAERPAAISIASIRVIRNSDDSILYAAEKAADFEKTRLSEDLTGHRLGETLLLIATSSDPHLSLPPIAGITSATSRLEIALEVQSASPELLRRYRHILEERELLTPELERGQAKLAELEAASQALEDKRTGFRQLSDEHAARVAAFESEVHDLQALVDQERAASAKLAADLETERSSAQEREAAIESADEQIKTLHLKIADLHDLIAENRGQVSQLSAHLEAERTQNREQVREMRARLDTVQSVNREQTAHIERYLQRISSYESSVRELQSALEQSRGETNWLSVRLETERTQNAEAVRGLTEEKRTIASELEQAGCTLRTSREENVRLYHALKIQGANATGLRAYQGRLERRMANVSRELRNAAKALAQRDVKLPSVFDSLAEDIERIRTPSKLWKAVNALGGFHFAPPGAPRSAAERRAIAAELKLGLRDIRKALSSEMSAPEDAAFHLTRLFELRRQTRQILDSLKPWAAVRSTTPAWNFIHWGRHALSSLSEKRHAAVLFDSAWYLGKYPDVVASNADPLDHYFSCGAREGRNPNAVFDTNWYLSRNPDVASSGMNPLEHYCKSGAREGRDPSALFSTTWYLSENPDVAEAGINPLQHYLQHGVAERRNPHPLFDCAYYLKQNPGAASVNPIEHYLGSEAAECGSPHPLFDAAWYLELYVDVAASGVNPLLHYLDIGGREGRDPHPLFDSSWYLDSQSDVRHSGLNPLVHYIMAGSKAGRDPHPLFDTSWYRSRRTDLLSAGCDPLTHYLTRGVEENTNPNPLFETSWYLAENPDVGAAGMNPLVHFNLAGGFEGRDPHPLFDSSWYLEQNPDVRESGINPLSHYLLEGALQGRDPHPLFESKYYEEQRRALQFSAAELQTGPRPTAAFVRPRTNGAASVVYAFTSICLNYVPKAIVLARTLKQYNPAIRFCVLVNDRIPEGALDAIDVFDEVIPIEALDIQNKPSWIFRHTVVELCTAVKGYFMVDLLDRKDCAAAFYFDPDIVCFSALDVLTDKLATASILLTPHLTDPEITHEAILDNEICALKHGVYNLGFLGLRPSAEGRRFARWWRDRLRDFCRADIAGGLFTDQRWVDLAPALFQEVDIVRHPGCNAATWNLTNRNIEGDFANGFTVNGEPLIFYHFSGFDSGAQGAMLDKYGGEMPAAQLLRKWYIQETTKSGDAHFSQLPWTLGSFSNGEPISDAQRILYRDRVDVQKAFPNPFEASAPNDSYYHWYHSEVLGRPIAHDGGGYNPLIEFIQTKSPLSPNPYFHSAWYLQQNPDVAAAGINPLLHFVVSGAAEGRRPNPGFYPAYYRRELPPEQRSGNPLTHYIVRGAKERRRTDPRYHPITDGPLRDHIRTWARLGPPLILLVSHYGGGGTEKHLRDLTESAQGKAKFIRLIPGHDGFVRLVTGQKDQPVTLTFDSADQFQELVEVLRECDPQRIHIHHILGNEEYLAALVHALKRPFDFTIHDYYVLAPSPHLVGPDARYVGDDLDTHEDELLAASIAPRKPSSLLEWQHAHSWLVTDADRVIAPSHDVARRFSRFFPLLDPIVAAHPEANPAPRIVTIPALTADSTFRVAVLGDLLPHKGKDIILECANVARARGYKISFDLIGDPHDDARLLDQAGIWVSGRYDEDDVQALLKQRQPHLIWYPALCPETFSYTLSIGLVSGIPLVVTDLGSLPERVAGQPWTWIRPWQFEASDWLSFFLRIREENLLSRVGPKMEAISTGVTSKFYSADYLAVLKDDQAGIERLRGTVPALTTTR